MSAINIWPLCGQSQIRGDWALCGHSQTRAIGRSAARANKAIGRSAARATERRWAALRPEIVKEATRRRLFDCVINSLSDSGNGPLIDRQRLLFPANNRCRWTLRKEPSIGCITSRNWPAINCAETKRIGPRVLTQRHAHSQYFQRCVVVLVGSRDTNQIDAAISTSHALCS